MSSTPPTPQIQSDLPRRLVVTLYHGRSPENSQRQTVIWNTDEPLGLGHPFEWVIESSHDQFRIRNLSGALNQSTDQLMQTLGSDQALGNQPIRLPRSSQQSATSRLQWISLKPVQDLDAHYRPNGNTLASGQIQISTAVGEWIRDTRTLASNDWIVWQGNRLAQIQYADGSIQITPQVEGIFLDGKELANRKNHSLQAGKLESIHLSYQNVKWWLFSTPITSKNAPPTQIRTPDPEAKTFYRALGSVGGTAMLAMIALMVFKKADPVPSKDAAIPPQYAKIIMKQTPKNKSQTASAERGGTPVKTAKETAVVKTFKTKAFKKSLNKLLKGGLSKMLKANQLVTQSKTGSRMLASTDPALTKLAVGSDTTQARQVNVGALGGAETRDGQVGYGKGKEAGIGGQGTSFVSLDIGQSDVATGLTRDQVGKVIHAHLSEVRYCYESAMLRNPDIEGRLVVDFTINGGGLIKASSVKDTSLPDPRLDDCILRRLAKWKFPKPRGGVDVAVTYPFIFKSLGR